MAFLVTFLPGMIDRVIWVAGGPSYQELTVVAFTLVALNGFVNSILYFWKRKFIKRYLVLFGRRKWSKRSHKSIIPTIC